MSKLKKIGIHVAALAALLAAGCKDDPPAGEDTPDAGVDSGLPPDPGPTFLAKRPSKSSTVAITEDDSRVLMVNPEDDSVSIFRTSDDVRVAKVTTGDEPSSVVISPDGKTAFVSNRAAATVVKISGIDGDDPQVVKTVAVGSEPTGVALSPSGKRLYVAEFAEGRITILSTSDLSEIGSIKGGIQHPRAVAVTNDNDDSDDDETIIVPEFYGEPNPDKTKLEDANKLDESRIGRVRLYDAGTLAPQTAITFAPRSSGITPTDVAGVVSTSANQLYSVGIQRAADGKTKIYLPSISASPQAPVRFDGNVYPVLWVGDLTTHEEDKSAVGTVNLAEKVLASAPAGMGGKLFLADIVDLDFVPVSGAKSESNVAYVVSRGADAMQRITFDAAGPVLGLPGVNLQVDLIGDATKLFDGCKAPDGIILRHDAAKAYVSCRASHRLGVVALGGTQALQKAVESFPADPAKLSVNKGFRFFFTGRGRWSGNATSIAADKAPTLNNLAWGNCGSCHPDGLSDNVTWIFGSGPRQTTSLDGTYSKHGAGPQKQRALNWTAIFDEVHDFDKNTRDTSGGFGAFTRPKASLDTTLCGTLANEERLPITPGVVAAVRELLNFSDAADPDKKVINCVTDWTDIDNWIKTIRPPAGLKRVVQAQVDLGRAVFGAGDEGNRGNCVSCHGGKGFTVSNVFWKQTTANTTLLAKAPDGTLALNVFVAKFLNQTLHLQNELITGGGTVGPLHATCGLRAVTTFGPAALEKKDGIDPANLATAQGNHSGFNVPSLYGMSLGAPYLHSGLALTLDDLLNPAVDAPYRDHFRAGNPNFNPSADELAGLKAYVLSIDASSDELPVPVGNDACPTDTFDP